MISAAENSHFQIKIHFSVARSSFLIHGDAPLAFSVTPYLLKSNARRCTAPPKKKDSVLLTYDSSPGGASRVATCVLWLVQIIATVFRCVWECLAVTLSLSFSVFRQFLLLYVPHDRMDFFPPIRAVVYMFRV